MSSWITKLIVTLGIVFVALGLFNRFGPGIPVHSVVTQKQDLFTVSGEGKVTVVPDTGIVDLGVTSSQSTVLAAQNQANTVITDISDALKELDIDAKDIKTSNYSIYPQYDYSIASTGRITGYQVNVNLNVTVREIDKINQVVDAATSNGANTVGGIQLTVDEARQKELLQQAREEAVEEAKTKAEGLARAAGISLGKIINVVESEAPGYPGPLMFAREVAVDSQAGGVANPTNIQAGSTDITTSVTLFYETR